MGSFPGDEGVDAVLRGVEPAGLGASVDEDVDATSVDEDVDARGADEGEAAGGWLGDDGASRSMEESGIAPPSRDQPRRTVGDAATAVS